MTRNDFRKISESDHVPIIRKDTEEFLERFIKRNKIKKILEYGTAIGYSASFFKDVITNGTIYSVEKDEYAYQIAKFNLMVLGSSDKVHLIKGDARNLTDELAYLSGGNFDLVFIDGGKSHYRELMEEAMRLCRDGGYILSDDIWQRGLTMMEPQSVKRKHRTSMRNMHEYLDYITACSELDTEIFNIGDGLAVSEYREKNG